MSSSETNGETRKNTGKYRDLAEVRTGADPGARGVPGKKGYANSVTLCIFPYFYSQDHGTGVGDSPAVNSILRLGLSNKCR